MAKNLYDTKEKMYNAFLFGIKGSSKENYSFDELENLSQTANLNVVGKDLQFVREVNPATFIGTGKIEELKSILADLNTEIFIVDHELSGSQIKNLSNQLKVTVIDRIMLILDIFAKRATTNEGKLQVELAKAKYILPRLASVSGYSGRFGLGGVGSRGPGETKLELDRRVLENHILMLKKQIEDIEKQREVKNKAKYISSKKKVAIVGYTNAGKSTLLNAISKANIYTDDKLFATLETTSRKVWLGDNIEIILTDTVGFINKLPHFLVYAFKSTLDEVKYADIILHVVDATDKDIEQHINVVNEVLNDLKVTAPIIMVYNKCDKIHILPPKDAFVISAKQNTGIDLLKEKIKQLINN